MQEVVVVGLDLARNVFQVHGLVGGAGVVVWEATAARAGAELLWRPHPVWSALESAPLPTVGRGSWRSGATRWG